MKKILGLLLAMILAIGMCGCSSGTSSVKEYNIDEFLPTYRKILSSIEEKTQYWSEDELQSSKYTELVKKEAESGGFSLNQTIITVSYTHLDVYKRQPFGGPGTVKLTLLIAHTFIF